MATTKAAPATSERHSVGGHHRGTESNSRNGRNQFASHRSLSFRDPRHRHYPTVLQATE
jgi:hypothetical protein